MAEAPVNERRRAAAVAGHAGDEATARAYLEDTDGAVRATALGALARLGRLGAAELARAASDPEPRVRARAAELCGQAADPGAELIGLLVRALEDPDPSVVEAAAFGLGETGEVAGAIGAVGALAAVVRGHREALCREAAVAALGAIGSAEGLPAILDATSDKPAVRRRAVLALAPFSGPEVDAALERALQDRDWQVRQAAEDLTGRPA